MKAVIVWLPMAQCVVTCDIWYTWYPIGFCHTQFNKALLYAQLHAFNTFPLLLNCLLANELSCRTFQQTELVRRGVHAPGLQAIEGPLNPLSKTNRKKMQIYIVRKDNKQFKKRAWKILGNKEEPVRGTDTNLSNVCAVCLWWWWARNMFATWV